MKSMKCAVLALFLFTTGCVSMQRDHGLSEVAQRVGQELERSSPATTDDPRVRSMLQAELDADRVVAVAVMNNPRLQVTLAELGVAQADLMEASTISNPMLELEVRFPADPFRPYEITIAQSLVDLITLPRRRAAGRLAFELAQYRVSSEVLGFGAEARDAYYTLLAATQSLAMTRTNSETARTSADLAARQHSAGNITDLDLEQEQAVYEQAKLELARSEEQVVMGRESLIRVMGLRDAALEFTMPAEFPPLPERDSSAEEIEALMATRRLDLMMAQREVEIAKRLVRPDVLHSLGEVVVDVHREREAEGGRTTGPGIEFPIPIFNTGRAARTRAEANYLMAAHRVAELTVRGGSEARSARQSVAAARARVEYYRDVVLPRRARIVQLTKLEQNSMLIGIYQLLDARKSEANARREYIEAQRDYWSARTNLDRVMNGVGGADFDMPGERGERRSGNDAGRGDH